jgi:hypothetical protein
MKVAVIEGHDIGGTCVNRGCVPSKALLAAAGRIREMQNEAHMKSMGIQVRAGGVWVLSAVCVVRTHVCVCEDQVRGGEGLLHTRAHTHTHTHTHTDVCLRAVLCCVQVGAVSFDRQGVANHATQLANNIQGNLKRSLEALGVVSCGWPWRRRQQTRAIAWAQA